MDIAKEMGHYLADAGFGTMQTDIFVGQLPAEQNGIYVSRIGGTLHMYDPLQETILDIYVKDTMAADCIATLELIKKHIHRMHNTVTTNSYIYSILAIGDIEDVGRDLEYAKLYKITISVINRDTGLIS